MKANGMTYTPKQLRMSPYARRQELKIELIACLVIFVALAGIAYLFWSYLQDFFDVLDGW